VILWCCRFQWFELFLLCLGRFNKSFKWRFRAVIYCVFVWCCRFQRFVLFVLCLGRFIVSFISRFITYLYDVSVLWCVFQRFVLHNVQPNFRFKSHVESLFSALNVLSTVSADAYCWCIHLSFRWSRGWITVRINGDYLFVFFRCCYLGWLRWFNRCYSCVIYHIHLPHFLIFKLFHFLISVCEFNGVICVKETRNYRQDKPRHQAH
jgi:hypothetical protein